MAVIETPLPPFQERKVPLVDPETGKMTRFWYDYFKASDRLMRSMQSSIVQLEADVVDLDSRVTALEP